MLGWGFWEKGTAIAPSSYLIKKLNAAWDREAPPRGLGLATLIAY